MIFMNDQLKDAGIFKVTSGDEVSTLLAFNYDRKESDLKVADQDELEEFVKKNDRIRNTRIRSQAPE